MKERKFIFCQGLTVRTGTNYMGKLFSYHPEIATVPEHMSKGEFPLLRPAVKDNLYAVWRNFNQRSFLRQQVEKEVFTRNMGSAFEDIIVENYNIEKDIIFLKDPNINIFDFYDWFPDAKLILLLRDGRDFVVSFNRASMLLRNSYSGWKKIKASIKYHSGKSFVEACGFYNKSANRFLQVNKSLKGNNYIVVKYEDLYVNAERELKRIFEYLEVPLDEATLLKMLKCEVVGSSVFKSKKNIQQWHPSERTADFNPIGRWKHWGWLKKYVFKKIAGKKLIQLGYIANNDW